MRKNISVIVLGIILMSLFACCSYSAPMDWLKSKLSTVSSAKLSDTKVGPGLKEALKVGIEKTINLLSQKDGYFGNQAVKILLPESVKKAEPLLRNIGVGPKIDEFTLSMNRAAEKAAPVAADIFSSAITEMSFDNAQKVLQGGNAAATDYLKDKTQAKLLEQFQPVVRKAMDDYAVTNKFEEIMSKAQTLPLVGKFTKNIDINKYVSSKALDGLFKILGQQEANIRTNPAARVTDLLKQVFSE